MITEILDFARKLDTGLRTRLRRPYQALLGAGLVIEIVKAAREAPHWGERAGGPVPAALAIALFSLLLLHQVAELGEHIERRRRPPPAA